MVLCIAALLLTVAMVSLHSEDSSGATINVSDQGELLTAIENAVSGDTVVLNNDIELTARIYIADKDITLDGGGHTLKRGTGFSQEQDARGYFNPGLIEVASDPHDSSVTASLVLKNITIDDADNPDGFTGDIPLSPGDGGVQDNTIIYDSVISTYSPNVTITLDDGTSIINIGGASAIRMCGGTLTLDHGSYVEGSNESYKHSTTKVFGAIWLNGNGTVLNYKTTMVGKTIVAPYFYTDLFNMTINFYGKINDCSIQQPLFKINSNPGLTLYTEENSEICDNIFSSNVDCMNILGGNGNQYDIELNGKINGNTIGRCILYMEHTTNPTVILNGEMSGNTLIGTGIGIYMWAVTGNAMDTNLTVNGQMSDNTCYHAISLFCTNYIAVLGPQGKISDNTGSTAGMVYLNDSGGGNNQFHIYGELSGNTSVANSGGALFAIYGNTIYVHSGAKIIGNTSYGSGGGVFLSDYCTMIMDGGEISGNTALCKYTGEASSASGQGGGGGVLVARTTTFIMNGGTISGNTAGSEGFPGIGGGVYVSGYTSTGGGKFIMNGGTVAGNSLYEEGTTNGVDIAVGGSSSSIQSSPDNGLYLQIGKYAVVGTGPIGAANYNSKNPADYIGTGIGLLDRDQTVCVGTVLASNQTIIAGNAAAIPEYNGYSLYPNSGIWYSVDNTDGTSDLMIIPSNAEINKYLWIAAIQPMGTGGTLLGDQYLQVDELTGGTNGFEVAVPLMADAGGTEIGGYGIVLLCMEKTDPMTLDAESSGNGQFYIVSPGGPEYHAVLNPGDIADLAISPSSGWKIKSVILTLGSGAELDKTGDALSGNLSVDYYELESGTNVIRAVFEPLSGPVTNEYSITATASDGATINPSGTITVQGGQNQTFYFSAMNGYHIDAVTVDGKDIAEAEIALGKYTFSNVNADHTIYVKGASGPATNVTLIITIIPQNGGYAEYSLDGGSTFDRYVDTVTISDPQSSFVVVKAVANSGYSLDKWVDGSTVYDTPVVSLGTLGSSVHLYLYFAESGSGGHSGLIWWVIALILLILICLLLWFLIFWRIYYDVVKPSNMNVMGDDKVHRKSEYAFTIDGGFSGVVSYRVGDDGERVIINPNAEGKYVIPRGTITDHVAIECR